SPPSSTLFPYTTLFRSGLARNANVAKTLSMAFFSTAGTLWLYSGVMKRYASPAAIVSFHRRTAGAENAGFRGSPTVARFSPNMRSEEHTSELQSLRHLV